MANLDQINRTVTCEILPDFRKRVTRRYDINDGQATMKDGDKFDANVRLAWGTEDDEYTGCRLVKQDVTGQTQNPNKQPNDPPAFLIRVFEQLPENDRVIVGLPAISFNQYGFEEIVVEYIQLSSGSTPYTDIVGVSTFSGAVLKTVEGSNDGTVRHYKLTYTTGGVMSDMQNLRFGGKVIVRTIKSLNQIPATPSGFTLVGPGVEFVLGLPLYSYEYAAAAGSGGTPGTSGQISQGFTNNQGGNIAFDITDPDGATGEVICNTVWVSPQATTSNPVTQPTGFVLWGVDVEDDAGFRRWSTKSSFGGGQPITVDVDGDSEGALTYSVQQNDDDGTLVPAYPGTGTAYNIKLTHTRDNGFFRNTAIWKKPPASQTRKETIQFEKPGVAEFTGSPPQFVLVAPRTLTILVDVVVDYGTSQISDVPFTVSAPASFYEKYTPTDTGIAVTDTQALGRYLAEASGISGTNSVYNGILCDSWAAQLLSSVPSTFPSGATVLRTDNTPYLTDVAGVVVWRREKTSYTF